MLALRFALVIIFSGPSGPKLRTDALVVSVNVGDGGPGDISRLGERACVRRERTRGMAGVQKQDQSVEDGDGRREDEERDCG